MTHEHASPAIYAKILGILVAFTVITVLAAGFNFGAMNTVIALVIATVKASLVALFFMHLKDDKPMSAVIFLTGMVLLTIFLVFCVIDSRARIQHRPVVAKHSASVTAAPVR